MADDRIIKKCADGDILSALTVGGSIYVSTDGSDALGNGTMLAPVASLYKALSMVTTSRLNIFMESGEYVETTALVLPSISGITIKGGDRSGNTVISGVATTPVLTIEPTYTAANFEVYLEDILIKHTAQTGIEIDNHNMTKKMIVGLVGVSTEAVSTGDSISVTHTTAGKEIRIYARDCNEIEGLVHVEHAIEGDRLRFFDSTLIGGITTTCTGNVASEVTLVNCIVLYGGVSLDTDSAITTAGTYYRTDAGVFSAYTDGFSA